MESLIGRKMEFVARLGCCTGEATIFLSGWVPVARMRGHFPYDMPDPAITPELIEKHGLTAEEYARIETILGRAPNFTELGIFSVMWSEHCSYKNTRLQLRKFPT